MIVHFLFQRTIVSLTGRRPYTAICCELLPLYRVTQTDSVISPCRSANSQSIKSVGNAFARELCVGDHERDVAPRFQVCRHVSDD